MEPPRSDGKELRDPQVFCPYPTRRALGSAGFVDRQRLLDLLLDSALAIELASALQRKRQGGWMMAMMSRGAEHAVEVSGAAPFKLLIEENLVATRASIESYREMMAYLADSAPAAQRLMTSIISKEEKYVEQIRSLLDGLPGGLTS